jgi:hypothetical protein
VFQQDGAGGILRLLHAAYGTNLHGVLLRAEIRDQRSEISERSRSHPWTFRDAAGQLNLRENRSATYLDSGRSGNVPRVFDPFGKYFPPLAA